MLSGLIKRSLLNSLFWFYFLYSMGLNAFYDFYPVWFVDYHAADGKTIAWATVCLTTVMIIGSSTLVAKVQSRYGEISLEDYNSVEELNVLATSKEGGAYIVASQDKRLVFVTGHPEYDPDSLKQEYQRDIQAGGQPILPVNYFEQDDPTKNPMVSWRAHGSLLFTNWLNYYVYQTTPYDLTKLSE